MIRKGKVVLGRRAVRTATNKNHLNLYVMFEILISCALPREVREEKSQFISFLIVLPRTLCASVTVPGPCGGKAGGKARATHVRGSFR